MGLHTWELLWFLVTTVFIDIDHKDVLGPSFFIFKVGEENATVPEVAWPTHVKQRGGLCHLLLRAVAATYEITGLKQTLLFSPPVSVSLTPFTLNDPRALDFPQTFMLSHILHACYSYRFALVCCKTGCCSSCTSQIAALGGSFSSPAPHLVHKSSCVLT